MPRVGNVSLRERADNETIVATGRAGPSHWGWCQKVLFNRYLRGFRRERQRGRQVNERRGTPRYGVEVDGIISSGSGGEDRVAISNLSLDGCRFSAPRRRIATGTVLTMKVGPVGILHARVAWRLGAVHGVSFDQQLHPAVLDHIRLFLSREPALIEERPAA